MHCVFNFLKKFVKKLLFVAVLKLIFFLYFLEVSNENYPNLFQRIRIITFLF